MEYYTGYFAAAIVFVFIVFIVLAREQISLWKKLCIFVGMVIAALSIYFGAADIIGRANPLGNSAYLVHEIYADTLSGDVYVFALNMIEKDTIDPRLFVLRAKDEHFDLKDGETILQKAKEIAKQVQEMQKQGKRVVMKTTPKRKRNRMFQRKSQSNSQSNTYQDRERSIFREYDPLKDVLPPKANKKK